jgi:hypothetical protein
MEYLLQKISKLILYLSGWQQLNHNETIKHINQTDRHVITFSHTSTWDAILFLLYKAAHPEIFENFKIVVKPQVYNALPVWGQNVLNRIGFIKATAYEEKNGGFIKSVIDKLRYEKKFSIMLSPKGKRENSEWRSGYYIIAKELKCDIMACGLDYEKKKIVFFDPISIDNKSKDEVEPILKNQLGEIIPLHTVRSEVKLRKHRKENITLMTISFIILVLLIFMTYLSWYYKVLFVIIILLFFILL